MTMSHITSNGSNSPSYDNMPNSNQHHQQPSMFQWPYNPQYATQTSWTQLPHPQQGHPTLPFWPPQQFGANIPPIFQTFNVNGWQANPIPGFPAPWGSSSCLPHVGIHQLQQSWEPQFMINNQLWSMVNKLQVELSEYKERLTRLEEEVSSLKKHKGEKSTNEIVRTSLVGIEQEDGAKGSAKEENEEEIGDNKDDTSSAA